MVKSSKNSPRKHRETGFALTVDEPLQVIGQDDVILLQM